MVKLLRCVALLRLKGGGGGIQALTLKLYCCELLSEKLVSAHNNVELLPLLLLKQRSYYLHKHRSYCQ